jgi:hypothetical protein
MMRKSEENLIKRFIRNIFSSLFPVCEDPILILYPEMVERYRKRIESAQGEDRTIIMAAYRRDYLQVFAAFFRSLNPHQQSGWYVWIVHLFSEQYASPESLRSSEDRNAAEYYRQIVKLMDGVLAKTTSGQRSS